MHEFDAVTRALNEGISTTQDLESLSVAIMRALLVPVGDHDGARKLPKMLRVTRRMLKAGEGSADWLAGEIEVRRLWEGVP